MRSAKQVREMEEAAAAYCREKGLRLTDGRVAVLRAVAASRRPVKAYDLIKNSGDKDKKPMPPIVYRALDFWVSHGFIHRIESLNAYTCCTHPGCGHDCQILICSQCGRVFEFCDAALSSELVAAAKRQGFKIEAFKVEAEGRCPDCR